MHIHVHTHAHICVHVYVCMYMCAGMHTADFIHCFECFKLSFLFTLYCFYIYCSFNWIIFFIYCSLFLEAIGLYSLQTALLFAEQGWKQYCWLGLRGQGEDVT